MSSQDKIQNVNKQTECEDLLYSYCTVSLYLICNQCTVVAYNSFTFFVKKLCIIVIQHRAGVFSSLELEILMGKKISRVFYSGCHFCT